MVLGDETGLKRRFLSDILVPQHEELVTYKALPPGHWAFTSHKPEVQEEIEQAYLDRKDLQKTVKPELPKPFLALIALGLDFSDEEISSLSKVNLLEYLYERLGIARCVAPMFDRTIARKINRLMPRIERQISLDQFLTSPAVGFNIESHSRPH